MSRVCQHAFNSSAGTCLSGGVDLTADSEAAWRFHQSLPSYQPTPLVARPDLADALGLSALWVKDESHRFGLDAFKGLGASYAVHRLLREREAPIVVCTATEGNHGRAVAWAACQAGVETRIFVPSHAARPRIEKIEDEGGAVTVVEGPYDRAVQRARAAAETHGWELVQDTAWPGYTQVPAWIMAGYVTALRELEEELHPPDRPEIDVAVLQAGVGSWAASAVWYYCQRYGAQRPRLICVEPAEADGVLASVRSGKRARSQGTGTTIMAGLNCATPSLLAWPILNDGIDLFLAVPDRYAEEAMNRLYHPGESAEQQERIVAGEAGAAGLAGVFALCTDPGLATVRDRAGLDGSARVLVFNTEGATHPERFRAITGTP